MPDGRLFLFYVHRQQPCGMRLVCSFDGGVSFDLENEIVICEYSGLLANTNDHTIHQSCIDI